MTLERRVAHWESLERFEALRCAQLDALELLRATGDGPVTLWWCDFHMNWEFVLDYPPTERIDLWQRPTVTTPSGTT